MPYTYTHLPSLTDPVALTIGSLVVRWYGVLWIAGFAVVGVLLWYRFGRYEMPPAITPTMILDVMLASLLGALLGGRLGYVFFYDPTYFLAQPLAVFYPTHNGVFEGIAGMSFHGGVIGVAIALWVMARRRGMSLRALADAVIPAVPAGYMLGRVANFLNGELYGRPTASSLGMYFPSAPDGGTLLRHPSQLYEALGEGAILFAVLWWARNRFRARPGFLTGLFFVLYGVMRMLIEMVRAPDPQLGIIWGMLTMGQILSLILTIIGIGLLYTAYRVPHHTHTI